MLQYFEAHWWSWVTFGFCKQLRFSPSLKSLVNNWRKPIVPFWDLNSSIKAHVLVKIFSLVLFLWLHNIQSRKLWANLLFRLAWWQISSHCFHSRQSHITEQWVVLKHVVNWQISTFLELFAIIAIWSIYLLFETLNLFQGIIPFPLHIE